MESKNGRVLLTSLYFAALLAPTIVAGVMQATWPFFQPQPVSPYIIAVIFCARYGGLGPGLLALAASLILTNYFLIEPYSSFWLPTKVRLVQLLVFAFIGVFISVIVERMRREKIRARVDFETASRAEKSLREKERFPNRIADLSPVVINVFDLASQRNVYISPDVVNLLGYTPSEIAEMDDFLSVLVHPRDLNTAKESLARLQNANDGETLEFEYRIRHRNSQWRWVTSRLMAFERDESGALRQIIGASLDITDRTRVGHGQRDSQRKYESLVQSVDGIVWEADPRTFTFTFVSKQAEKILGYPLERWFEGPHFWTNHLHPNDRDWATAFCRDAADRRVNHQFEYRMIAADGSVVWLRDLVTVHIAADQTVLLRGVMVDITERKRIEETLRASEQRYRELFENARDAMYVHDLNGIFISVNRAAEQLTGYSREEIIGKHFREFATPSQAGILEKSFTQKLLHPGGTSYEVELIAKDGRVISVEVSSNLIHENGVAIGVEGLVRDITERRRSEKALLEAEQKYRDIFENAVEGIFQTTPDGRFIAANPALARMLGFDSPKELITTRTDIVQEHYVDAQRREALKLSLTKTGFVRNFELEAYRKDGSRIWTCDNVRAVRDEHGSVLYYEGTSEDITERKQAEEALREAERKYRAIFENAEDGIFQTTPDGKTVTANPALARILGFDSPEQLIRERTDIAQEEYVDPAQRDEFKRLLNEHDVLQGLEHEVYRKDGSRIWISESVRAIRNENGTLLYYEGTTKDITVQKRAEEALLASERRYRDIFTFAPVGIYQSLRDGTIITANNTLAKMLGYASVDELLKVKLGSGMYLSEDERERVIREHEVRGYPVDLELQWMTKDRSPIWIQLSAHAIRGANGITEYWEGFVRDITSSKRAEEALREAERKYRDIFENAGEGIFQSSPEGQFIAANPALARIHGYDSPQELMRSLTDISTQIYVDSKRRDEFRHLLAEQGTVRALEHQVFKKDGSRIWITVNARAVKDGDGRIRYYEGTSQDITERKHAEERLREYEKVVEGLEEMIVVVDRNYRYLLANRAYLKNRRLEREMILGRSAREVVEKSAFDNVIKLNLDRCFQGQVVKYEMKLTYPDLGERDLLVSYLPIEGPEGVDRVACVLQDVTERKQAEQRLAYHARLLEQVHDAIIAVDDRLTLTAWNHAAEQMYGWTANEVLGRDIRDVVRSNKSEAERAESLRAVDQTGRHRTESIHHRKDGSEINVEGTIMALRNGDNRIVGYAFAYHDITERKRAEEAIRNYSRRLIEAQEAERQSISRELHDQIGQVLTAIRINLETIAKCDDGANSKFLIDEGVTLVDQALQQVRNLSFELRPSLLDDLGLASALRWYADRYTQRGNICVTTRIELPEHQPRLPRDLETVCFRIVQEALTNVARHAQAKKVLIDLGTSNDGISLSIKDDGIGFDKHSRNPASLPHPLGLRGMEERALALGGKLEINSAPSRGTEILAHFPDGKRKES